MKLLEIKVITKMASKIFIFLLILIAILDNSIQNIIYIEDFILRKK